MKRFVVLACLAIALIQHKADDNQTRKQGQHNTQGAQDKSVASAPSQSSAKAADQKPAGNADKNQNQTVTITSIPKVVVNPEKDFEDWTMVACTIILTIVGIVGTCAAIKTLKAINRQAHYMLIHARHFEKLAKATANQADLMQTAGTHTESLAQQAVQQTTLTQSQLELSQRPWVSVTRLPQSLQFNAAGAILGCTYKLENCGGSVAWNISIWADLVPEGTDWRPTLDRLQSVMTNPQNEKSDYGYVLFPKESLKQYQPSILRRQDLDDLIKKDVFKGTRKVGFKLVGCIDYRSHVSLRHYQTAFVDLVGCPDQTKGTVMGAFDPTVAAYMSIILTPHGHGASAT